MRKPLRTLAAATAALGLAATAPTAAQAFVIAPAAAAAWIAGSVIGGVILGTAVATNGQFFATPAVVAAPGPGVTINRTTCYFTNRLVNPVTQTWTRERVCTTVVP